MGVKKAIKTQNMNEQMPKGFKELDGGIYYADDDESGESPKFVCSHAQVRARTVDEKGKWGQLIEFLDYANEVVRINVTASMSMSQARLSIKLAESGMRVGDAALLSRFIRESQPNQIIRETPPMAQNQLVVENIREFIIKNQKRFQNEHDPTPIDRAGFLLDGEICFTKEALRVASGITATRAAKILEKAGLLLKNEIDHLNKKTKTTMGEIRLYCINTSILEYDPRTLLSPVLMPEPPISEQKPQFQCAHPNYEKSESRSSNECTPKPPIYDQPKKAGEKLEQETKLEAIADEFSVGNDYYCKEGAVDDVLAAFERGTSCPTEEDMAISMFQKAEADEVHERRDEWTDFLHKKGYKISRVLDIRRQSENEPARVRSLLIDAGFFENPAYQAF